ncbi:hypothetical protein BaRGS_00033838 [Batillaria attramentaria]|uniref:Uncharacterized protein n=1 Tax=Batillaria attramentaria TaxID=370345 RepID=A0ABD0JJ95_9CAEN
MYQDSRTDNSLTDHLLFHLTLTVDKRQPRLDRVLVGVKLFLLSQPPVTMQALGKESVDDLEQGVSKIRESRGPKPTISTEALGKEFADNLGRRQYRKGEPERFQPPGRSDGHCNLCKSEEQKQFQPPVTTHQQREELGGLVDDLCDLYMRVKSYCGRFWKSV